MGGSTQNFMYGMIIYFAFLSVVVTLFSIGGAFDDGTTIITSNGISRISGSINNTAILESDTGYSMVDTVKDLYSFFVFNISIYGDSTLMSYLWLIRTIFVFIPLLFLILGIYYSLPLAGGH